MIPLPFLQQLVFYRLGIGSNAGVAAAWRNCNCSSCNDRIFHCNVNLANHLQNNGRQLAGIIDFSPIYRINSLGQWTYIGNKKHKFVKNIRHKNRKINPIYKKLLHLCCFAFPTKVAAISFHFPMQ